jgi:prevent-host-death family protein
MAGKNCIESVALLTCSNITTETFMSTTTISSRDFNQDRGRAKKAALEGPVFITDRGRPAHVLLSIEDYQRLTLGKQNIADLLAMPGVEDVELEIVLSKDLAQAADLS